MSWSKEIDNFLDKFVFHIQHPEGNCRICNAPIFNKDSPFGEMGLCMYCHEAYVEGLSSHANKK